MYSCFFVVVVVVFSPGTLRQTLSVFRVSCVFVAANGLAVLRKRWSLLVGVVVRRIHDPAVLSWVQCAIECGPRETMSPFDFVAVVPFEC